MRLDGTIKSWNDERGFGFIEPTQGGQEIFVHIKAFSGLRERPQPGQRISFEVEQGPQGKPRAINAEPAGMKRTPPPPARQNSAAQRGTGTLAVLSAFGLILLLGYLLGHPPRWLLWAYLGVSAITFLAYASDKSAAKNGAWRTPEQTLHMLALFCGWPGALLAQQFLRHKSAKQEFRSVFWTTVVLNVLGFVYLASPYAQQLSRV
jgi:uncharacterized membrane protein YsdA (DUF1294 family)/cold shock CspA family protein